MYRNELFTQEIEAFSDHLVIKHLDTEHCTGLKTIGSVIMGNGVIKNTGGEAT